MSPELAKYVELWKKLPLYSDGSEEEAALLNQMDDAWYALSEHDMAMFDRALTQEHEPHDY